jgi:predicted nucleic acid-binding protein
VHDVWVVNASPLIVLAKVGYLHLLERLAVEILIPRAVANEVFAGPADDDARKALEADFGRRCDPVSTPPVILEWALGGGETAVLALAQERAGTAVLDDASARACARSLGVPVVGTLGVIVRAKVRGIVPAASPIIAALRDAGLYLDDEAVAVALREIGETWQGRSA